MGAREWFSKTADVPQQSASQNTPQPETSRVENLSPEVKAQAVDAARPSARIMEGAAKAAEKNTTHSGQADGREALIRNQGDQGKEQSAMSPTDHGKSHTPPQERSQSRGRGME